MAIQENAPRAMTSLKQSHFVVGTSVLQTFLGQRYRSQHTPDRSHQFVIPELLFSPGTDKQRP